MGKLNSLLKRKRTAVEDQVEEFLGPASQLDELISGHPLPNHQENKTEKEESFNSQSKNQPG